MMELLIGRHLLLTQPALILMTDAIFKVLPLGQDEKKSLITVDFFLPSKPVLDFACFVISDS